MKWLLYALVCMFEVVGFVHGISIYCGTETVYIYFEMILSNSVTIFKALSPHISYSETLPL